MGIRGGGSLGTGRVPEHWGVPECLPRVVSLDISG